MNGKLTNRISVVDVNTMLGALKQSKESVGDKLEAIILDNNSKRNYDNLVKGPRVFDMVIQKKSKITLNKSIRSMIKDKLKNFANQNDKNKLYIK